MSKKKKALRQPRIRTCPDNKAGTTEGVSAADQNVVSTEAAGKAMSLFPASSGKALLIGSLLLLVIFYCSVALRYGGFAGWRDDSIYLCTAKSLAEGRGFRHMETPGSPFETKYPPLYPATLALVFMLGGEFPKSTPLFFLPGAFAGAALFILAVAYCRGVFRAGRKITFLLASLAAISPTILDYLRLMMSELLYGALAAAALLLADRIPLKRDKDDVERHGDPGKISVIAALCALAMLTRSIGVTLVAAFLSKLVVERRWKQVAITSLVVFVFVAPYVLWKLNAAGENGFLQTYRLTQYYLDYSYWLPHGLGESFNVIKQNLFKSVYVIGCGLFPWPFAWRGPKMLPLMHAAGWLVSTLLVIGFVKTARHRRLTIHYYAAGYFSLMLAWPFPPSRFFVPWVPFLLFWIIEGLRVCLDRMHKSLAHVRMLKAAASVLFSLFVVGTAVLFMYENSRLFSGEPPGNFLKTVRLLEREKVAQWVNEHTLPSDIIASDDPAFLFLRTGRRGFDIWPIDDPYRALYSSERSWTSFYFLPVKWEVRFIRQDIRSGIAEVYSRGGIGWVIIDSDFNESGLVLSNVAKENPQLFQLAHASPSGRIVVYRYLGRQ